MYIIIVNLQKHIPISQATEALHVAPLHTFLRVAPRPKRHVSLSLVRGKPDMHFFIKNNLFVRRKTHLNCLSLLSLFTENEPKNALVGGLPYI